MDWMEFLRLISSRVVYSPEYVCTLMDVLLRVFSFDYIWCCRRRSRLRLESFLLMKALTLSL